jgi:hypothetical protein
MVRGMWTQTGTHLASGDEMTKRYVFNDPHDTPNDAVCGHDTLQYWPVKLESGEMRSRWRCSNCGAAFTIEPYAADKWALIYDTASRMPSSTGILSGSQIVKLIDELRDASK